MNGITVSVQVDAPTWELLPASEVPEHLRAPGARWCVVASLPMYVGNRTPPYVQRFAALWTKSDLNGWRRVLAGLATAALARWIGGGARLFRLTGVKWKLIEPLEERAS